MSLIRILAIVGTLLYFATMKTDFLARNEVLKDQEIGQSR